jgi:hypothetical protein
MDGLNNIVSQLNRIFEDEIFKRSSAFNGYRVHGLTTLIKNGNPVQQFPAIFQNQDGQYAGVDDSVPLIIYHRAGGVTISENPTRNYGNNRSALLTASFNMTLVAYVDSKVTCVKDDELLLILLSAIPETIAVEPFDQVNLRVVSAILNPQQVFQTEYQGIGFFLNPESFLLSVNYTIESKFRRNCFNYCPTN